MAPLTEDNTFGYSAAALDLLNTVIDSIWPDYADMGGERNVLCITAQNAYRPGISRNHLEASTICELYALARFEAGPPVRSALH